ncbi:MAG TPA: hypothetical protein VG722_04060 [Tepidisphaeraceae bacterium]|nr:hypothetical protein [Tepidisphaeraceae bacterium]
MKLRILDNSIRLRLSRSEVEQVASGQTVESQSALTPEPFRYRLTISMDQRELAVTFRSGTLTVLLPSKAARQWATTDQVSIECTCPASNGSEPILLLIEKDFKCLHGPAGESQEDCFPNPKAERE